MRRLMFLVAALLSAGWSRAAAQGADSCSASAAVSSTTFASFPESTSTPSTMAALDSTALALGYTQVSDGGSNGQSIFEIRSQWPQGIDRSFHDRDWWAGRPFPGIRLTFRWLPWRGSRRIGVAGALICAPSDTGQVAKEHSLSLAAAGLYEVLGP